jgi:hypothetical protein
MTNCRLGELWSGNNCRGFILFRSKTNHKSVPSFLNYLEDREVLQILKSSIIFENRFNDIFKNDNFISGREEYSKKTKNTF